MSAEVGHEARRPSNRVGLLSRHSLLGGAVVLGVALFYIVAVPVINGLVKGPNQFEVDQPFVAFDSYQFTPEEGWELESANDLFVTISKAGANVVFTPLVPADQTLDEAVRAVGDALSQDQNNTWVVGEPVGFVTDVGDHGATLTSHTTNQASQTWAITDGTSNVTVLATSPDVVWPSVSDEIDSMVKSIVFLPYGDSP